MRVTPQKLHKVIRDYTGKLSSKFSPSQRIDRTTYDVYNGMKYTLGVMSGSMINEICSALDKAGIKYNDEKKDRGLIVIMRVQ